MAWDTEGTKRKILDAATTEFADRGPAGTTIERIAKLAGVNKERVYNYYGGKSELFARVLANAAYLRSRLADLGYDVVDTGARDAAGEELHSPVVPVLVGDDWKAALLWKALYDGGVYTNVALYPAVERGGALLRTSLMATHEREHLDRALGVFESCRSVLDAE